MDNVRILIVEDNAIIATRLKEILTDLGYEVPAMVPSGEEAVRSAIELSPHVVLMDIRLEGVMTGIEAAGVIRSAIDIPVIYLTAYAEEALLQQARSTEPYGYLVKPVQERELDATIKLAVYKHSLDLRLKESEQRYRTLFDNCPISVWEIDFSVVKAYLDDLLRSGATDLRAYLTEHPEEVILCARAMKVLAVNGAGIELFDVESAERLMSLTASIFCGKGTEALREILIAVASGQQRLGVELDSETSKGKLRNLNLVWSVAPGCESDMTRVLICMVDVTERNQMAEALRLANEGLEKTVELRTRELEKKTLNLEEVNGALRVLLKQRAIDKEELTESVLTNIKNLVLPYLEKLRRSRLSVEQATYVGILEAHIREITSPFIRKISQTFQNLTPMEIRVAEMIRDGMTTKEMADILNLAPSTVLSHRENLRNKLGLRGKKINLRSYLQTVH